MPELPELTALTNVLHSPLFQQGLVLLTALGAGLLVLTVMARLDITSTSASGRALAAYRTDALDTPLEQVGAALIKRLPGLSNLLGLEIHRRWLALEGPVVSAAATVGFALVLALVGFGAWALTGIPALLAGPVLGFLLPFVRQRSAADKVMRRVQNNLPDLSAMLAAEMAAGNPPDRAIERAAELGGPLARILQIALAEQRATGRPVFSRGKVAGLLVEVASRYPLPALRAFVAQDRRGRTGADVRAGPHPDRRVQGSQLACGRAVGQPAGRAVGGLLLHAVSVSDPGAAAPASAQRAVS
jgi:Flp pilus assembly protein TadB